MVGIQLRSTVGERGQVVIPKPLREKFHLHQNTEVLFEIDNDQLVLRKKNDALVVLQEFLQAVKIKRKFPKNIDWDKEYYSQFEK